MTNLSHPTLSERIDRAKTAHASMDDQETASGSDLSSTLAHGKAAATPFIVLGGVAIAVWSAVAVVAGATLLIWWLV